MSGKDFNLEFGVDLSSFLSPLAEAKDAVLESAGEMKEALASVTEAFGAISESLAAFTAILAGGEAFKQIIGSVVKLNVESAVLGRQFGISATEASVLKEALNATHVSQEDFSAAASKITKTLNTNEQAFHDLGVATRDSSGNLRPLAEIVLDTNEALGKFKEGTDRNVEAQKIYGKSFLEFLPAIKLTREAMDEAQKTAEELGYTVTKESEAMTGEYRASLVGVSEVLERLEGIIGQAVMPVLTTLGEWFRSIGPQVIEAFRAAVQAMGTTFSAVGDSIKAIWQAVGAIFTELGTAIPESMRPAVTTLEFFENVLRVIEVAAIGFRGAIEIMAEGAVGSIMNIVNASRLLADVAQAALTLNWSNVEAAWNNGLKRISDNVTATAAKIVETMRKTGEDADAALMQGLGKATGTPTDAPKAGKSGTLAGDDKEFNKQLDAWIKELDLEYAALKKQHEAEIEVYKQQEAEFSKAAGARIAIAEQEVEAEARAYGKGSPQYEAAQKHLIEIKQQANEQLNQMAEAFSKQEEDRQLQQVDLDQKILDDRLSHHQISNAKFEELDIALENRRTAILESGIRERMALIDPTRDPVAYAKLDAQIEQLEQQHQARLTQIKQKAAIQDQQLEQNLYKQIQSAFTQNITKMLEGTETFSAGMKSIFKDILADIIQFLAQWGVEHAAQMVENLLETKTSAQGQVQSQAGVAGAAGVASFAGAPWPIDVGAPGFGASMAIAAQSFGSIASAAEGYDIPARTAPLTQLHEREMVLPKPIADPLREALAKGRLGGSGLTLNIKAIDSKSFESRLRAGGSLHKVLKELHSRGVRG